MKILEPIFEGKKHYYLCPRFGVAMQEGKNIPTNRKCPNSHRNAGKMGCSEICYYNPIIKKPPTPIGNLLPPDETEGTVAERDSREKTKQKKLKKLRESRKVGVKFPYELP